jgi:hypothetical protein
MIITMQKYPVKITAGEGNFKFFPVDFQGALYLLFHKHFHLKGINEEINHFAGIC